MSYTKQTWQTGDVITAEKLNHMEDGIGDGGTAESDLMVVRITKDKTEWTASGVKVTADKSYAEIQAHLQNGGSVIGVCDDSRGMLFSLVITTGYGTVYNLQGQEVEKSNSDLKFTMVGVSILSGYEAGTAMSPNYVESCMVTPN